MNQTTNNKASNGLIICYIAYLLTLSAFFVSSFFPELRLWGINHWAYLPEIWRYVLFGLGILILIGVILFNNREENFEHKLDSLTDKTYYIFSAILVIVLTACFILFKVKTYFLGDGYGFLSQLTDGKNVFIRTHEIASSFTIYWINYLLKSSTESHALLSYQIYSISTGVLLISICLYISKTLFSSFLSRIIFALTIFSSGFMLLFFGYVENYALFNLFVIIFCLTSLLVIDKKANKLIALIITLLAISFHIFGVTLIPALLYLIFRDTKIGAKVKNIKRISKLLISSILTIIFISIFYYFYLNNYFFRFSIVPIFRDRFTVENYTIFSSNHILDFLNLLFILFPSVLLVTLLLYRYRNKLKNLKYELTFFSILLLSNLSACFIFNPRLGMPRDWDLFAFCGIPLIIGFSYVFIKLKGDNNSPVFNMAILVISLNLIILIPRIHIQNNPEPALEVFLDYIELDKKKNRYVSQLLYNYYTNNNMEDKQSSLKNKWSNDYPEEAMLKKAVEFEKQKEYSKAISLYHKIIALNPIYPDAYNNLGICYYKQNKIDTSITLFEISKGFSPNRISILYNLGLAYYSRNNFIKAEKEWLRVNNLTDTLTILPISLAKLYKKTNQKEKSFLYFKEASKFKDAPLNVFLELGYHYYNKRQYSLSAQYLKFAQKRGLEDKELQRMISQYPLLKPYFKE
ncbi:MAG: tetratricopeptide repeat protein [candidate division Zixibacteria bacterium]|nr:tetratricopeptide repeat protein [candidate division Zixibacteria bacterium]